MNNPTGGMNHAQIQTWLRSGDLIPPEEQAVLRDHLSRCRECWEYAAFVDLLGKTLPEAVPPYSLNEAERRQKVHQVQAGLQRKRRVQPLVSGLRLASWAATGLLLVLGVAWAFNSLLPRPTALGPSTQAASVQEIAVPKPTQAGLPGPQGDYGFLSNSGFVDLQTSRLLAGPVAQSANGQQVEVVEGVTGPGDTRLWLQTDGKMPLLEGARLELPGESEVGLSFWNDPDPSGASGPVELNFPPLPAGASQATLALVDGWRLPLEWIASDQSGVPSVSLDTPACNGSSRLNVCVLAANSTEQNTQLLLYGQSLQDGAVLELPLIQANAAAPEDAPALVYGEARRAGLQDAPASQGGAQTVTQAARFEPLPAETRAVQLHLPAVSLRIPLETTLELDLGPAPQTGSSWQVDLPVQVGDQAVRFTQAALSGDGTNSLRLELTSDPVEVQDNRLVTGLEIGKPEGIQDLYGYGFDPNTRRHQLTFELVNQNAPLKTGALVIPIISALVTEVGPFDLSFSIPRPAQAQVSPTPRQADSASFAPPLEPTPLSLEAFQASDQALVSGQALVAVVAGDQTGLYASAPGGEPTQVAALPGQVYDVFLHPDLGGMDYLTRTSLEEGSRGVRLFTLRLDGSSPRQLLGPLEIVDLALASADRRYLFFTNRRSLSDNFEPYLLDLQSCRESGRDCSDQVIPLSWNAGDLTLGCPAWSQTGHRLSFCGSGQTTGASDVYVLDLDQTDLTSETALAGLTNFSNTPDHSEGFGGAWLPEDEGLLWVCEPSDQVNVFGLCQKGLEPGAVLQMPAARSTAPTPLVVSPDGRYAAFPDWETKGGQVQITLYQREQGLFTPLAQVEPFDRMSFSPDSSQLLVTDRTGQVIAIRLADLGQNAVLPQPASWAGWVP